MERLETIDHRVAVGSKRISSAYVPPFQLTKGQPPPIAANGGLSYMSFDRDGDAGTALATEAALRQLAEGAGQAVIDLLDNAPLRTDRDQVGRWLSQLCRVPRLYSGEQN